MNVDEELGGFSVPQGGSALTIGVFDGVHRGHRHLISYLRAEAQRAGLTAGIVTFRNHPQSVLRPGFKSRFLSTIDERLSMLRELGIDLIVPITFDLELSELSAGAFVALLKKHLLLKKLVLGPDFAMGHGRGGNAPALTSMGRGLGFSVKVVDRLVVGDGQPVRSTSVRQALALGDVERASNLLGRSYALSGEVVRGEGRGGPLGFPTANLMVPAEIAVPVDGIYAAWAHAAGQKHKAAVSIGERPTFAGAGRAIEAFVLDFKGDLYGQHITLEFVRRLRDEQRFDSVPGLQEQVGRDVAQTRAILSDGPPADSAVLTPRVDSRDSRD